MKSEYEKEIINSVIAGIKAAGFRVFIAERGSYGFYTDAAGSRVVCFGIDLCNVRYSGNYKTSAPKQTGTGWQLQTSGYDDMFNQFPPRWAVGDATWKHTTLEQHLKTYQASSKYTEAL